MAVQNQKLHIFHILEILMERTDEEHTLSAPDMIRILEDEYGMTCDRRTVYSDIETLQQLHVDIVALKGRIPGYFIASREFELPELKILVDIVQASKFISEKKSRELISKLEKLCSRHEARQLSSQVTIMNRPKTDSPVVFYNIGRLHEAIFRDRKIEFQYVSWTMLKTFELRHDGIFYIASPLSLIFDDENYYLIAYDEAARMVKHYRVDKMQHLSLLEEPRAARDRIRDFDLSAYAKKTIGMYGGEDAEVIIRGNKELAGVILDRFGRDIWMRPDGEDRFVAKVFVAVSPQFYGWMTAIGEGLEIIGPAHVREGMAEHLRRVLGNYM